jgi:hypothetical protein
VRASKNIKGGKEGEGIKNRKKKKKEREREKEEGKKEKEKRKKEKGKEGKKKGSPVERVEAVAVAGGSKVCMSKKLIADKPSPNPLFFNNGLLISYIYNIFPYYI